MKTSLTKIIFQLLIVLSICTIISFILIPGTKRTPQYIFEWIIINTIGFSTIFYGCAYISSRLDDRFPWIKKSIQRLIIELVSIFIYATTIFLILNFFIYKIYIKSLFDLSGFKIHILYNLPFFIGAVIFFTLFFAAKGFLSAWKESATEAEKHKLEKLSFQYETLKNQINPHFLFNALNTLTSLVYKDANLSAKFIKQLSDVYRYVLEQKDKELVNLDEELRFVKSYLYLQKIRYADHLKIDIHCDRVKSKSVIPLSIQMLVENAIKHNTIGKDQPLCITISIEDDRYIVVRNNLQRKTIIADSKNIGLNNIKSRYEYITHQPCTIQETSEDFTVKLPLINEEQ